MPSVAMAYVAEEVDAARVGHAMGLYIAGSALCGMGGRLAASLIADAAGWREGLAGMDTIGLLMGEAFRRLAPPAARFAPAVRSHQQVASGRTSGRIVATA